MVEGLGCIVDLRVQIPPRSYPRLPVTWVDGCSCLGLRGPALVRFHVIKKKTWVMNSRMKNGYFMY